MFLKDVEATPPPDRGGRYAAGVRQAEASGHPVPGIWRLFAYKPALADALGRVAQEALRGPSPLPAGLRELIAAFVSSRNRCRF